MRDFVDYLPEVWTEHGWSVFSDPMENRAAKKRYTKKPRRGQSWVQHLGLSTFVGLSVAITSLPVGAETSDSTLSYFVAPRDAETGLGRLAQIVQALKVRSLAPFSSGTIAMAERAANAAPSAESPEEWAKRMAEIIVNARD